MSQSQQLPLFDDSAADDVQAGTEEHVGGLSADTPIEDAIDIYMEALKFSGVSHHTVKAFKSDINLLARWTSPIKPIGAIGTEDLNRFLHWMLNERGKPCSPKTYARRVTTLKHFFGYLYEERIIPRDPSNAVIQKTVRSPLPLFLFSEEVDRVLDVTRAMWHDKHDSDARPHLLVTLLLQTGMKKNEVVGLLQRDVHRNDTDGPFIRVRYDNPQMRYKERKIAVDADLLEVLDVYLAQRKPKDRLIFDCTPRNLEYVLRDVANRAGVERKKLSFETLRWTCALRDYMNEMEGDDQRQKLGLSRISWTQTSERLAELVAKMAS